MCSPQPLFAKGCHAHLFTCSPGHLLICSQLLKNSLWHLTGVFVSWCCCNKLPQTGRPKTADIYSLIKIHNEGLAISCSLWRVLGGSLPRLFLVAPVSPWCPQLQAHYPSLRFPITWHFPCVPVSLLFRTLVVWFRAHANPGWPRFN